MPNYIEEDMIRVSAGGGPSTVNNKVVYPTISLAGRDPLDFGNVQKRKDDAEAFLKLHRRGSAQSKSTNHDSQNSNLQDSTTSMEEDPASEEEEEEEEEEGRRRPSGFPVVTTVTEDDDDDDDDDILA